MESSVMKYVKTNGHFLKDGKRLIGPGSVVSLDEDTAKEFVRRELGALHPGPEVETLPEDPKKPGAQAAGPGLTDLGDRLVQAERSSAGTK